MERLPSAAAARHEGDPLEGDAAAEGRTRSAESGAAGGQPGPVVQLTSLPPEVLFLIAHHLDPADIRALGESNHAFVGLAHDDNLWRAVYCRGGMWRQVVTRREQAVRWATVLAERKELTCDPRTRFECLAELLIILAEHAEEAQRIRSLGLDLSDGLLKALEPSEKRPSPAVRLAYIALAYLAFDGITFGEPLREEFVLDDHQVRAMWTRQFGGDTGMSMAVSYLFASLALRHNHYHYDVKLPTPLLPLETYDESDSALLDGVYEERYRSGISRSLSGPWRGNYFYPDATTDQEMLLYLGTDKLGQFTIKGKLQFSTGMVTFCKGYEHAAAVTWIYRGKLNGNGLAGTWGDVRWGGTFMIWPDGKKQDEQARARQEQAARLQLAQLVGSADGSSDLVALPEAPTRRPQCFLQ